MTDLPFSHFQICENKNEIVVEKANLEDVLKQCFSGKGLDYSFENKTIVIRKKENSSTSIFSTPVPPVDVHGRVTDSLGNPLAGASITVKGTRNGTRSDANGMFTLKLIEARSTLIISFTGFESKEYKLNGQDGIAISLSRSTSQLDQIQVIAYGTQTQRFSVGNVTTVSGEEIAKQPVTNALLALEGRVPGLLITQTSGISGSAVNVQIQGQNSILNGNDPFYVIDGVPYYSQLISTGADAILGAPQGSNSIGNGISAGGSPFSYINSSEIESITILKDADATSIYGSRAANGAILITAKKGKAGKTKVELNLQQGSGHITHEVEMLNTRQYLEMRREAFKNDGLALPSIITDPNNTDYDVNGLWDTTRYTNWQKSLIGRTSSYTNLDASISGGTTNIQYLIGGNYNRQNTVFPGNFDDKKASIHFNLKGNSPERKFYFQFSASYLFDNNQLPSADLTPCVTSSILFSTDVLRNSPQATRYFDCDQP
jgi:TonB-dependent SusC/RagA subfamily outer membrane receptor